MKKLLKEEGADFRMHKMKLLTDNFSFGKMIHIIFRKNAYYIGKRLEKYGISKSEYHFLIQVYINEGCCQEEIVNRLDLEKYEVAKGIKSLVEKGFVCKRRDEEDKRKHRLFITEKGKEIKEDFIEVLKGLSQVLTEGFTDAEKDEALEFMMRMHENISKETMEFKKHKL